MKWIYRSTSLTIPPPILRFPNQTWSIHRPIPRHDLEVIRRCDRRTGNRLLFQKYFKFQATWNQQSTKCKPWLSTSSFIYLTAASRLPSLGIVKSRPTQPALEPGRTSKIILKTLSRKSLTRLSRCCRLTIDGWALFSVKESRCTVFILLWDHVHILE